MLNRIAELSHISSDGFAEWKRYDMLSLWSSLCFLSLPTLCAPSFLYARSEAGTSEHIQRFVAFVVTTEFLFSIHAMASELKYHSACGSWCVFDSVAWHYVLSREGWKVIDIFALIAR